MNIVALTGRFVAKPELRKTTTGKSVVSFTLAVKSGRDTMFIRCVAWEKCAEIICTHFEKGTQIGITGGLTARNYTDKNGNQKEIFEVSVDDISFIDSKRNQQNEVLPY